MSLKELVSVLAERKGACPVVIVADTIPTLKGGKGCPLLKDGEIRKRTVSNVIINFLYENSVNNQRAREDISEVFKAEPRKWGSRLHLEKRLLPFVHHIQGLKLPSHRIITSLNALPHCDELYLETKIQTSLSTTYFQNGKEIDASIVEPFLPERNEGQRQQVEKKVILRDYKLINIRSITMDQKIYEGDPLTTG